MSYSHILKGVQLMDLYPTIWRTCRVLSNQRRLACLRAVLLNPGDTVGELAHTAALPEDQASLCLRALQARGLLRARRESRWVHYYPLPDPLVPTAAPILAAMEKALLKEKLSETQLIRCLTAFTHPRRLTVLRVLLQNGPTPFMALARKCRISQTALSRHLRKLLERQMVLDGGQGWTLDPDHTQLADLFLTLTALSPEA